MEETEEPTVYQVRIIATPDYLQRDMRNQVIGIAITTVVGSIGTIFSAIIVAKINAKQQRKELEELKAQVKAVAEK